MRVWVLFLCFPREGMGMTGREKRDVREERNVREWVTYSDRFRETKVRVQRLFHLALTKSCSIGELSREKLHDEHELLYDNSKGQRRSLWSFSLCLLEALKCFRVIQLDRFDPSHKVQIPRKLVVASALRKLRPRYLRKVFSDRFGNADHNKVSQKVQKKITKTQGGNVNRCAGPLFRP